MYLWCAYTLNSKVFNFLDGDLTPPAVVTRPGIGLFFFFFFSFFFFSLIFFQTAQLALRWTDWWCAGAHASNTGVLILWTAKSWAWHWWWSMHVCPCGSMRGLSPHIIHAFQACLFFWNAFVSWMWFMIVCAGLATVYELNFDSVFSDVHVWDIYSFHPSAVPNKTGKRAS